MREAVQGDDSAISQFIETNPSIGIQSKSELIKFVKLMNAIPNITLIDGDVTNITYSHTYSQDTGKETAVVYVLTQSENGDWTRIEYVLSVSDVYQKIMDEKSELGYDTLMSSPIQGADGRLLLYIETRQTHPSENGTMIQWVGQMDGIFVRVFYYTEDAKHIDAQDLFEHASAGELK